MQTGSWVGFRILLRRLCVVTSFVLLTQSYDYAADVVFDNTSSPSNVSAGDNVTVPDHAGVDGNSSSAWI